MEDTNNLISIALHTQGNDFHYSVWAFSKQNYVQSQGGSKAGCPLST